MPQKVDVADSCEVLLCVSSIEDAVIRKFTESITDLGADVYLTADINECLDYIKLSGTDIIIVVDSNLIPNNHLATVFNNPGITTAILVRSGQHVDVPYYVDGIIYFPNSLDYLSQQLRFLRRNKAARKDDLLNNLQAREILSHITCNDNVVGGVDIINIPAAYFCGDIVLARYSPNGHLHILLGDFTGHGLGPAIATVPAATSFNAMTDKGLSCQEILYELNMKLSNMLPTGVFLAAALVEFDPVNQEIVLWNCGLPDILLINSDSKITHRFSSKCLPLGIQKTLECDPVYHQASKGSRLMAYTDGLIEIDTVSSHSFNMHDLDKAIVNGPVYEIFDRIKNKIFKIDSSLLIDDITAVMLDLADIVSHAKSGTNNATSSHNRKILDHQGERIVFESCIKLCQELIRETSPVTIIMNMLQELSIPGLRAQDLFIILSELITNSIDHGLLRLDSTLKTLDGGFGKYMEARRHAMEQLVDGEITINIKAIGSDAIRYLEISITDSGDGFDYSALGTREQSSIVPYGRGIELVRSVGYLEYLGCGNKAKVFFSVADRHGERREGG